MPTATAFFRGNFVPLSEANVNITTHALHYGTAVFEVIRGNWNEERSTMFVFRPSTARISNAGFSQWMPSRLFANRCCERRLKLESFRPGDFPLLGTPF